MIDHRDRLPRAPKSNQIFTKKRVAPFLFYKFYKFRALKPLIYKDEIGLSVTFAAGKVTFAAGKVTFAAETTTLPVTKHDVISYHGEYNSSRGRPRP